MSNQNNLQGYVKPNWERVRSLFEQNLTNKLDIGATLCVYYRGECVVDLAGGWKDPETKQIPYTSDTLQLVFSATKGVMATAIALCVENGWLDYDKPIAKYWPEFAANNKQDILLGDLLSHRAGLPFIDQQLTTEDTLNWSQITSLLAAQKPHWQPGSSHGYHAHTMGFLVGELLQRVDPHHRSCGQFIHDELGQEFYVGVPNDEVEARVAPLILKQESNETTDDSTMSLNTLKAFTCCGAFPLERPDTTVIAFNETRIHRAVLPAANGITNARSLARIYARLIGDINEDGHEQKCLLSDKTLAQATKNVTPSGELDCIAFDYPTVFSMGGFEIYSDDFKKLGNNVFGHTGLGGSCALAIPERQLVYVHVCNYLDFKSFAVDPRSIRMLETIESILAQHG